ncbi:glycosyltransferase [Jeotgalicoccus sp. S0W5]|uniref:glycosyltransferase n=1 Tax=Jeotgalicoccus sp. S0W5 TaxID=2527874 RepID=UPI0014151A56|nr:glycosyltransferase [Jeotgalicoccus sp. S0W5]
MKPRIIILLNSIDINRGGLTHASLRQASTFADAGYDTQILTFNYEPRFPIICKKLKEMGKVSNNVVIRNMFEDKALYGNKDKINMRKVKVKLSDYEKHYAISQRKNHNAYRLYNNGLYEKYIALRKDDTLDFIDYFNENRYRVKRENYNYYGHMTRVQYFSFEENKVRQQLFFDKTGKAFLNFWKDPSTGKISRVIHLGSNNNIISETTGDTIPHKIHWLKSVLNESNERIMAISDTRSTDELLVKLKHPNTVRSLRMHSNHLKNPDNPDSELNKRNGYAIENIKNVDALIVLTDKQKHDIVNRFGLENKVHVIPNYYEAKAPKPKGLKSIFINEKQDSTQIKRDLSKVVIVSRFASIKNIDHTIQAFKKVVTEVPEAKLEIWGSGDQKDEYADLIKSLDLSDNVLIKGYTEHPEKIYQSGGLSVLTSNAEGFSLAVMESMANSSPVVSYNIRYGPSDMIEDGVNGFLIDKSDIDALSEKMIHMLKNPEKTRDMGNEAKNTIQTKFSKEIYQKLWFSLTDTLLEVLERNNHNE